MTSIFQYIKVVMLLFILMGFKTNTSIAQLNCTDGMHSYVTIDQNMSVSQAINLHILLPDAQAQTQAQFVILNAPLIIDQDYHFSKGSDIIGSSYSQILINAFKKLYMDSVKFHGCDILTGGIYTNYGSKLFITNSKLYNINTAIAFYGDDAELTLIGNHFYNNAISISTHNSVGMVTTIYGNTFTGGDLVQPYGSGKTIALDLYKVDNFDVGTFQESPNIFEDYNGHSNDNAFIQIKTNDFSLTNSSYFEFLNCKFNNIDSRLYVNSADDRMDEVVIQGCDFTSTLVYATELNRLEISYSSTFERPKSPEFIFFENGGTCNIDDCTFEGEAQEPIHDGIYIKNSSDIEITNNNFDGFRFGIIITDCTNLEGIIKNNVLTTIAWSAIRFMNNICVSDYEILANTISSNLLGITCNLNENVHIGSNNINVEANSSLGEAGISVTGYSNFIKVTDNVITGTNFSDPSAPVKEGLILENSSYLTFECNHVNDIRVGFSVFDTNLGIDLIANKFKKTKTNGVKFDMNLTHYGYIGDQYKTGNSWKDVLPPWNELQDPKKVNKFTISNLQPGPIFGGPEMELIPNPYIGNVVIVGGNGSNMEMDDYCYVAISPRDFKTELRVSDFDDIWRNAMLDQISTKLCEGDCDGYLSSIQYDILTGLYYNPNLLDSIPEAQTFWDNKIDSPLGKIFMTGIAISGIKNKYQIDSIATVLSGIGTNTIFEDNLKKAFQYRLKAFKSGSNWNNEEKQNLLDIANQCMKSGGKGVIIARSLLHTEVWDKEYDSSCDSKIEGRSIRNSTDRIKISPNPNYGTFNIQFERDFDTGKIVIFDLYGQSVYKEDINGAQNIKISTNLHPGTYFVKIFTNNKLLGTYKMEVIK